MECEDCPPPPDFMALPPPPPPPHLPDLCHYQGDCAHHPVISLASAPGPPDIMHVVSLAAVTSLTIILVFTVSCVIVYRNRTRKLSKNDTLDDDAYKQVSLPQYPQLTRGDIRVHPGAQHPSPASFNYYSQESAGEHIYEVIDDSLIYDVIKPPGPGPRHCAGDMRGPRGLNTRGLVSINLDRSCSVLTDNISDNYRQFNSLKSFKSHRNRSYI